MVKSIKYCNKYYLTAHNSLETLFYNLLILIQVIDGSNFSASRKMNMHKLPKDDCRNFTRPRVGYR